MNRAAYQNLIATRIVETALVIKRGISIIIALDCSPFLGALIKMTHSIRTPTEHCQKILAVDSRFRRTKTSEQAEQEYPSHNAAAAIEDPDSPDDDRVAHDILWKGL